MCVKKMHLLQRHSFYNAKHTHTHTQRNLYLAVGSIALITKPQNRRHYNFVGTQVIKNAQLCMIRRHIFMHQQCQRWRLGDVLILYPSLANIRSSDKFTDRVSGLDSWQILLLATSHVSGHQKPFPGNKVTEA